MEKISIKKCCDCNKLINYIEYRRINPSLSTDVAKDLWENPLITIYCPDCFLKRPEKPYRKRKRFLSYYRFKLKDKL
jgi:hypothetical protein